MSFFNCEMSERCLRMKKISGSFVLVGQMFENIFFYLVEMLNVFFCIKKSIDFYHINKENISVIIMYNTIDHLKKNESFYI